ncbi:MAG: hypothetical protein WCR51_06050 [Planctomycetia bacterium]
MTRCVAGMVSWLALCAAMVAVPGCKGKSVDRYGLSGSVAFRGEPVPCGRVTFEPDAERGNAGPGTSAFIVDGRFSTIAGKGHCGGPHVIRILGFRRPDASDEGAGRELFAEHVVRVDLPRGDSQREFVVPDP